MKYVKIEWPEAQELMSYPWFDECILDIRPEASPQTYLVPINRYNEYLRDTSSLKEIKWLVDNGVLGDEEITGVFHGDQ